MPLESGLEARVTHTVGPEDTAPAHGSGDVEVLATPRLVGLCERAAVEAVAAELEEGETTVGTRVDVEHSAPSPPGRRVEVVARLDEVEGRRLVYSLEARDDRGAIGGGRHVRVRVDRARFLEGASG